MSDTVGIKIPVGSPIAKCVSVIRKIEPDLSISSITSRIKNAEYVLSYDSLDDDGVKAIIKCYDELIKLGITPTVYDEDDEECEIDLLRNLSNMYEEISDEVDAEIEMELNNEEEE